MSQNIICPNCSTQINLDLIAEEKYKNMLEIKEKELKQEMNEQAIKWAEEKAEKLLKQKQEKDSIEMQDLKNRLVEQEKQAEILQKQELEIRKQNRQLEQKNKNNELEMIRKLDEQKKKIEEKINLELNQKQAKELDNKMKEIQQDFRKKELEYMKQNDQMKRALDDAKRKAEQSSQQIQWDISEDDLKNTLIQAFPVDDIQDIATWIKWADLIQTVKNNLWINSWIIVWESKNTKSWTDSWIMKLKEDKLKVNWNIAVLVTKTLPKNIEKFWLLDDIMVCLPEFAVWVSAILRDKLISISKLEKSMQWKDIKMEMLYKYLSSQEFSSKISMMVDVFANLKTWIETERRAMEKNWKKREKDLQSASLAVTHMYWELESLMWQSLPWSEKLELPEG